MVSVLDSVSLRQNPLANVIEVFDARWEPWNLLGANWGDPCRDFLKLLHGCLDVLILEVAMEVDVDVAHLLVACGLWGH